MNVFIIYILCYYSSAALATISSCAKWNSTGVTIAGTGVPGSSMKELNDPTGIFIHKQTNVLYVADYANKRIQMFQLNNVSSEGTTFASFESYPFKVFVVDDADESAVYVSFTLNNRTEKWINETAGGVQIGDPCFSCSGIWVDKENNVYMAESLRYRVIKWSPETNETIVVAGRTDMNGSTADLLSWPDGIAVDESNNAVYVADFYNNRIQEWLQYAGEGITVAGTNIDTNGTNDTTLSRPSAVLIDQQTKTVYVVDRNNERIQRWLTGASSGDTIAGGTGKGNAPNQFNEPRHIDFDSEGNLYVADSKNHRIQMFMLIDNRPCSSSPTVHQTKFQWTMSMMVFSISIQFITKLF